MENESMRDVLITIKSSQSLGGESDGVELVTAGKYGVCEDGVRFYYMESEITGLKGTRTDFLVTPEQVIMSRTGTVNTQMVFLRGHKQHFAYETEFGTLTMGLDTHRIVQALGENGGDIEIEYDIGLERSVLSRNRFKINVKELKGN